jgi:hypothetical protein
VENKLSGHWYRDKMRLKKQGMEIFVPKEGSTIFIRLTHENPVIYDWDEMRSFVMLVSTVDEAG